jgi:L-fuculokinase
LKRPVTLVFDIGKTTKKALLFDETFNVLEEITESFAEIVDQDGFPAEDLSLVTVWAREILTRFAADASYTVTHVNFSAYGASLVCLDREYNVILPFYNYLKPCPEEIRNQFYSDYIEGHHVLESTASPWLGFLNSGIQAYWMKHRQPEHFAKTKVLLHLPQYFSFLFTGKLFNDKTSLGCHTLLWDFNRDNYHNWVETENLSRLFPPIVNTTQTVTQPLYGVAAKVGVGVHDSSAALMPYLMTRKEPFLMLSTGTWNICFNPWNHSPLTKEELDKDCLCYMTYEGKPVKASRIFLGHEHEVQQKKLAAWFQVPEDHYRKIQFNERIYLSLKGRDDLKFHPLEMEGTGPIPGKPLQSTMYAKFESFEQAQHRLVTDLVAWQKLSIDLVDPDEHIRDVILVGGFSKNQLFLQTLKREVATRKFFLSDHPRASALGAGWLVHNPASIGNPEKLLNINSF